MAKRNKDLAVRVRINDATLKIWKETAEQAGLSLSAWIRIRCNGMEVHTAPAPRRKAA